MLEDIRKRNEEYAANPHLYDWVDGETYVEDMEFLLSLIDKYESQAEQFEQFKKERREMIQLMVDKGLISAEQYLDVVNSVLRKE